MLNIGGLNTGIVIDHIEAGVGMKIYSYLHLDGLDNSVAIIKNARSNKMGRKDISKIEGMIDVDLDMLGVLDANITINIIEYGVIQAKKNPNLPTEVTNIIQCKNPRCITSIEQEIPHIFKLTNRQKGMYRCIYCEQAFKRR